jgi:heme-degrading monooxygenase HmoA
MILRSWKGVAKFDQADRYAEHLKTVTFPEVSKINGFLRGTVTRRKVEQGIEYLVVTEWESEDAIRQFAGDDVELAVVPGAIQSMMESFDHYAVHYEVIDKYEGTRGIKDTFQE